MSRQTVNVTDELYEYMLRVSLREPELLARLRRETLSMPGSQMQISPEQGQFMRFLTEVHGTRRAIEVGVYTGYSALSVALAMPPDGKLVACDVSEEWTRVARRYWTEAGVSDRIDLRLAPAIETLDGLIGDGHAGTFDFAFVDADKEGYVGYYERCYELLRPGGIVAFDNTLWGGSVADPDDRTEGTMAIRRLNEQLLADPRISLTLVPIGDGLTLARKH